MSKKTVNKKDKVEKVSKETGVEEVDLERLPVDALEKLDALTPDQELPTDTGSDENGDETVRDGNVDASEHTGGQASDSELESSEEDVDIFSDGDNAQEEDQVEAEDSEDVVREPILVGRHPVTKEPVYK